MLSSGGLTHVAEAQRAPVQMLESGPAAGAIAAAFFGRDPGGGGSPGVLAFDMEVPLRKTYEATPAPKLVVAVGDCARSCGVFAGSYAVVGSVDRVVPVDVFVDGCPPEPAHILQGILTALRSGRP